VNTTWGQAFQPGRTFQGASAATLAILVPVMRRDFFPEADSGAFEIAVRAPAGTRIENTEALVKKVDKVVRDTIPG
jgi:multidrug efflux pump subunit AcrB